jgi:hypothetical protein
MEVTIMTTRRFKGRGLGVLIGVLLLGVPSQGLKPDHLSGARADEYIEVHGSGVPCVPLATKFVKYDGEIRKISKFAVVLDAGVLDCQCPHCCDGECYIIVFTEIIIGGSPVRVPAIIWIPCSSSE